VRPTRAAPLSIAVATTGPAAARARRPANATAAQTGCVSIRALGTRRTLIPIPTVVVLLVVVTLSATRAASARPRATGVAAGRGTISYAGTGRRVTSRVGRRPRPRQPIIRSPRP
jgi:hypothetical protein